MLVKKVMLKKAQKVVPAVVSFKEVNPQQQVRVILPQMVVEVEADSQEFLLPLTVH